MLYADNWYFKNGKFLGGLARHLNMRAVGTCVLSGSTVTQASSSDNIHFPMHRPKAFDTLPRGHARGAELVGGLPTGPTNPVKSYRATATLYRDKQMVGILASAHACFPDGKVKIMRRIAGSVEKTPQSSFFAHDFYVKYFGGVDMMDQAAIAKFMIVIKSARWYLREFFWMLDVLRWNMWVIAQQHIASGKSTYYSQFMDGRRLGGHQNFVIQLGQDLIQRGIDMCASDPILAQQCKFSPMRNITAGVCRQYLESVSAPTGRARKRTFDDVSDEAEVEEEQAEGAFAQNDSRESQHVKFSITSQLMCVGCAEIKRRLAILSKKSKSWNFKSARTRQTCAACEVHLCDACWPLWNHQFACLRECPPEGFASWDDYVRKTRL